MPATRFTSLALALALFVPLAARAQTSALWGREGERWDPGGRLPDDSFAGYHAGRDPIPDVREVVHVRDFGARPGDGDDDTRAIQRAIDAAGMRGGGAVVLASGRYELRDVLRLDRSGVVLRGAGRNATTLHVTRSLSDVVAGGWTEAITRSFGFLQVGGGGYGDGVAVTEDAPRGARWLTLARIPDGVRAGEYVRLRMDPDTGDRSLWDSRHAGQNGDPHTPHCDEIYEELGYWVVRVLSVDGDRIELEQPLRSEIRTRWSPRIQSVRAVREVGIERLGIEFVHTAYPGHHLERGYNAIDLSEAGPVIHAWVRDVLIRDADNGINLSQAKHVTVEDVRITGDRGGYDGHHAFTGGIDCLYEDLEIDARFWHAVTFNERTTGTVVSRGTGDARWSLDHHSRAQIENLITDLRAPYDWISGGAACSPRAGARHTYWRFDRPIDPPNWSEIQTNVVGVLAPGVPSRRTPSRQWFEDVASIAPRNLFEAQRTRRLAIEDVGRFASGPVGVRMSWIESDAQRWAIREGDEGRAYWLASSVYEAREGGRVGEHAIADTLPLGDAMIRGRARIFDARGGDGGDVALLLGWQNARTHVMALFHTASAESGIYVVADGVARRIAPASPLPADGWHAISFSRTGTTLEMRLDDRVVATADDGTVGRGAVGVGSRDDSVLFDDLEITTSEPLGLVASDVAAFVSSALPFGPGADPSDGTGLVPDDEAPDAEDDTLDLPDGGVSGDQDGGAPDGSAVPPRVARCSAGPGRSSFGATFVLAALVLVFTRARASSGA